MINQVVVFGTIGCDPQVKRFETGTKKGYFSLAINQFAKGEQLAEPLWLDCEYWNEIVDRMQKCGVKKGRQMVAVGSLSPNVYTKTVGQEEVKISRVKLKIFSFQMIGARNKVEAAMTEEGQGMSEEQLADVAMMMLNGQTFPAPEHHA